MKITMEYRIWWDALNGMWMFCADRGPYAWEKLEKQQAELKSSRLAC
ncbi:hypothetical protein [Streptosporangium sp. NBC_01756]|nr:hypothetical protein [Streptosporangium sp. NBC_01756]WSC83636.1 hypothetical protein OIE48_24905 [Streptosporangium sp. NBC_01756]